MIWIYHDPYAGIEYWPGVDEDADLLEIWQQICAMRLGWA